MTLRDPHEHVDLSYEIEDLRKRVEVLERDRRVADQRLLVRVVRLLSKFVLFLFQNSANNLPEHIAMRAEASDLAKTTESSG